MPSRHSTDRTDWHRFLKVVALGALLAVGGYGYYFIKNVVIPMAANIEAMTEHMGIKPKE